MLAKFRSTTIKFIYDIFINLLSVSIPIIVLQLIIYPQISKISGKEEFGTIISIYSLLILINNPFGRSLNNIRLIHNDHDCNSDSDYTKILFFYSILTLCIVVISIIFFKQHENLFKVIILLLTSLFILSNEYLIVYFRLKLDYIFILKNSLISSLGLLFGFLLYIIFNHWELIFFWSNLLAFIYLSFTTKLLKFNFNILTNLYPLFKDSFLLSISFILSQSLNFLDKLILFHILSGYYVAVYYTSTLIGKLIIMITLPINSVILSYIAKIDVLSAKRFKYYMLSSFLFIILLAIFIFLISRPLLTFFFPSYVDDAMELVPFTTINVCIYALCGFISQLTLKYCKISYQIIIYSIVFFVYLVGTITFLFFFGLRGFCLMIALCYIMLFFILFFVYIKFNN